MIVADSVDAWQDQLSALEAARDYPLGAARFRIDHGARYAAFFERLGAPRFVLETDDDGLAGVAVAVRRESLWYLCDLKTRPGARGALARLLRAVHSATDGLRGGAYFVAMDPPGRTGRHGVARLLRRRPRFDRVARLAVYLAPLAGPAPGRWQARDEALASGGRLSSLAGVKDLVLLPSERPLRVAHVALPEGTSAAVSAVGEAAAVAASWGAESLCWTVDLRRQALVDWLADAGWTTDATASVFHSGPTWPDLPVHSDEI